MTLRVSLANILADRIGGAAEVEVEGATVEAALEDLTRRYPPLEALVWKSGGVFNDQLVLFRNGEDVRRLEGLRTPLNPADELMLITAVEGG